ncbi:hypothetical protein POJ06DRAFT_40218 [Lipomyces tetrasporus]|uniref:Uncharacterized protein n=1 Tax=Lipomyces tetrasporus TaxID=54092 RepID=A0AAD7VPS7_9ASCO|nr:uncharacterized protein POJ06DRAFT_40218 [Lipomyces tetrasporus]KAJ8097136.1 hypothetical protein POJ06DRAFT_40218 [Lipomyces tetrasporus]
MPRSASLALRSLFRKSAQRPHKADTDTFYSFDDQDDDTLTGRELEEAQLRMHRRGRIPTRFCVGDQSPSSFALDSYEYMLISPAQSEQSRWHSLKSIKGSFRRKNASSRQERKVASGEADEEYWDISRPPSAMATVNCENKNNKKLHNLSDGIDDNQHLSTHTANPSRWGTLIRKMSIRKTRDKLKPLVVDSNPVQRQTSPVYANESRYYTVTVPISPYTERSVRSLRSNSISDRFTDASSSLSVSFIPRASQPRMRKRSNRFGKWDTSYSRLWTLGTFRYLDADPYNNRVKQYLDAYRNFSRQQRHPRYEQLLDSARLISARAVVFQYLGME